MVTDLLRPLSRRDLHELGELHGDEKLGAVKEHATVLMRLRGWALTGPAAYPWRPTLGWRPDADLLAWCSCVTSAVTHRARLSADDVRLFAEPFADLVPGLERILNEPVVLADPVGGE